VEELKLRLVQREDWGRYFDPAADGTIFCPTPEPPAVGTAVKLEILFQGGPRAYLRCLVIWRRPSSNPQVRPGVGLRVQPVDQGVLEYIDNHAAGQADRRARRRLPLRLRVSYTAHNARRVNFSRDISEDGLFVGSADPLAVGEETSLLILPPGGQFRPVEVRAKVARVTTTPARGMGVKFIFADAAERERFASFVGRLEQQWLAGELPADSAPPATAIRSA
jgi:type IV pilus assembly protein PilZ